MSIDTDEVFARCELLIYSKIVPYLAENAPEELRLFLADAEGVVLS